MQALLERFTGHELENEEAHAIGFFKSVDRANAGVVERGKQLRFALKPCQALCITCERFGQELERDFTAQAGVAGTIDVGPAARSEFFNDALMAQRLPDHAGTTAWARILGRASG